MKKTLTFASLLILAVGIIYGCTKREVPKPKGDISEMKSVCCRTVIVDPVAYATMPNDDLEIISTSISGDCLSIDIIYSGGCGIVYDTLVGISKTQLRVAFDDQDNCKAAIYKTLQYNLLPLRIPCATHTIFTIDGYFPMLAYNY